MAPSVSNFLHSTASLVGGQASTKPSTTDLTPLGFRSNSVSSCPHAALNHFGDGTREGCDRGVGPSSLCPGLGLGACSAISCWMANGW